MSSDDAMRVAASAAREKLDCGCEPEFFRVVKRYHRDGFFDDTVGDVQRRLIQAVRNALSAAKMERGLHAARSSINEDVKRQLAVLADVKGILFELAAEQGRIQGFSKRFDIDLSDTDDQALELIIDAGTRFAVELEKLCQAKFTPLTADNANHLANEFVREMRSAWRELTGLEAPKDGGVDLRKIAVALWEDFCFPTKAEDTDSWLAGKFRRTA